MRSGNRIEKKRKLTFAQNKSDKIKLENLFVFVENDLI